MRKKLLCTISAVAMLSGLFVVAATPALADPPDGTQNFLPDETTPLGGDGLFLSDKEDGTDQTAHLTNVSTRDTSEVRWFLCPEDRFTGPGATVTDNDQLNGCTAIGTDNSGVTPEEGPGTDEAPETDEAYDIPLDIPSSLDNDTVDVVAAACINSAEADFENDAPADPDERNCTSDVEDGVLLDDASQGIQGAQSSAGEITSLCAISATSSDDCELEDGPDSNTVPDPDPEVDDNFLDFGHGSNIPNDRFTIRATTSLDVTEMEATLTGTTDATTEDNTLGAGEIVTCELIVTTSNSREYQCTFDSVVDNQESELSIYEIDNQPGTGGNCTSDAFNCELDGHYVVSQDRRADEAVLSFKREGSSQEDRDISLNAGCEEPDDADANTIDTFSHLVGCFFDQFGARRVSADGDEATFESEGVGEFDAFGDDCDDPHDHDDDGFVEHCHSDDPGTDDGEFDVEITSDDTSPPPQTITFCLDPENEGPEGSPPTDHGCNEAVVATATKTWGSGVANQVTLVFDDGDGNCDGDTFRENDEGDTDNLIACVFDAENNPVDTNPESADGQLQWFIGQGADDQTDTRFTETPPQETEEGNLADVGLQARDRGTDIITVALQNNDGGPVDSDTVEKQVERGQRIRSTVNIRHRRRPHRLVGTVNPNACDNNRLVRVRRVDAGPDTLIGSDRTNANGNYRVNHRRTNRRFRYYAQLIRNANCTGDRSGNTPRVR